MTLIVTLTASLHFGINVMTLTYLALWFLSRL